MACTYLPICSHFISYNAHLSTEVFENLQDIDYLSLHSVLYQLNYLVKSSYFIDII